MSTTEFTDACKHTMARTMLGIDSTTEITHGRRSEDSARFIAVTKKTVE